MSEATVKALYPVQWPEGRPRRASGERVKARFKVAFDAAWDQLLDEVDRFGADAVEVSTGAPIKARTCAGGDVAPMPDPRARVEDPAVVVRFRTGGRWYAVGCDTYARPSWNLRAVGATVAALRAIRRHGATEIFEQAMVGYLALPPRSVGGGWREVLGLPERSTLGDVDFAYRRLALAVHPDAGGSAEAMVRLNEARGEARRALAGGAA